MGAATGRKTDTLTLFEALAESPYRFDFYQALRLLECAAGRNRPRWGFSKRPSEELVRFGQEPDLTFAPASLSAFLQGTEKRPPLLQVRAFGLLGPNGPLPLHLTDYLRERLRDAGDPTPSRFLDMLQHRLMALFYRAWAQAQPHVNRDRPDEDRFAAYVGAFVGIATAAFHRRDSISDEAKLFHAGTLMRSARNADGLAAILHQFFRVPVSIEQFVGEWMTLGPRERTCLTRGGAPLGAGAVAGGRVWDRQHKFRIHVGPLTRAQYESFLPGGLPMRQLADWVRMYLSFELAWDVRLRLRQSEVPRLELGGGCRLGWTTWAGTRHTEHDADDLCLDPERFANGAGADAA
jgi:type VI secretion system protein ImpH